MVVGMRFLALIVLAAGLTLAGSACGGHGASESTTFTAGALPGFVAVRPSLEQGVSSEGSGNVVTRSKLIATAHSLSAPLSAALMKVVEAGFQRGYSESWNDGDAHASAYLFADDPSASKALAELRRYDGLASPEFGGGDLQDVSADGLGDESWGTRGVEEGTHVMGSDYAWRRGNLIVWVSIACTSDYGCSDFDVVRATREYADAVDARIDAS
jgi:hypothetical protein